MSGLELARFASREPRLCVAEVEAPEVVLGAFQRVASALRPDAITTSGRALTRRASGGPAVLAGPGTLHLALSLPRPDALVPATVAQLVNRHVRPLLAALARLGVPARWFGRDWISVEHRPASWIGWAHEATTGHCLVEAFVAVTHAFALPAELDGYPPRKLDPFLAKVPATLVEAAGRALELQGVSDAIVAAYQHAYPGLARIAWPAELLRPADADKRPAWAALAEEAIGFAGAVREGDRIALGGDMLASCELFEELAVELAGLPAAADAAAHERAVHGALVRGRMIDGLRDAAVLGRLAHEVR